MGELLFCVVIVFAFTIISTFMLYSIWISNRDITVEDCIEMYEKQGMAAIIEDGNVVAFVDEIHNYDED